MALRVHVTISKPILHFEVSVLPSTLVLHEYVFYDIAYWHPVSRTCLFYSEDSPNLPSSMLLLMYDVGFLSFSVLTTVLTLLYSPDTLQVLPINIYLLLFLILKYFWIMFPYQRSRHAHIWPLNPILLDKFPYIKILYHYINLEWDYKIISTETDITRSAKTRCIQFIGSVISYNTIVNQLIWSNQRWFLISHVHHLGQPWNK